MKKKAVTIEASPLIGFLDQELKFKYLDNQILVALDGTEHYSSKKINCLHCNCRKHRNGSVTYYHQTVTPVIVSPSKKQVINFPPPRIYQKTRWKNQTRL